MPSLHRTPYSLSTNGSDDVKYADSNAAKPPPDEGVPASRLRLRPGPWTSVLEALLARFPNIPRLVWEERFARGKVLDQECRPLTVNAPYQTGTTIYYYREPADEVSIAEAATVLHLDEHLLVADKPHGLAVAPVGGYARETLLARLLRQYDLPLTALHRIDRDTAGLVLFSINPSTRALFHALFANRQIEKGYLAVAPELPERDWPLTRRSRIERGEPFFRMRETAGLCNSETQIDLLSAHAAHSCYALRPKTGRQHQLRVHMSALGAPICGDPLYPELAAERAAADESPLQLLAHTLQFTNPISGQLQRFQSGRRLLRWS